MNEPEATARRGMSRFEYAIVEVMAAHDDEAPRTADLQAALARATSRRRRPLRASLARPGAARWHAPAAAAAAVALVAAASTWAGGLIGALRPARTEVSRVGHLVMHVSCPARYARVAPWVPARPTHVDGSTYRLVPRRAPSSAVMCAYAGTNTDKQQSGWKLSGRRVLTGGLGELAGLLSWQLRGPAFGNPQVLCTDIGGKQVNYLIRLTYQGGGRLWVAATDDPNACVGTSNGDFFGVGNVGWYATKAFASGRWPARTPISCQRGGDVHRLGQDAAMVPPGSVKMLICAHGGRTLTSGYQDLVSALNALPTFPSTEGCSEAPGPHHLIGLYFSYRQGPAVRVSVATGCTPAVDNLSLQATSSRTIWPVIQRLLNHG